MRIATWNMQGGKATTEVKWHTGVLNLLVRWGADVVCLQESGSAPPSGHLLHPIQFHTPANVPSAVQVLAWGGTSTRPSAWMAFYEWDTAGHRVNLAVVTRQGAPGQGDVALTWRADARVWRPLLGLRIGGWWVFSCHAIARGGPDAAALVAAAHDFAAVTPWVVAGDFNREPAGLAVPHGSVICQPNGPTHPATHPIRRYDYAVRSGHLAVTGQVLDLGVMSDHKAVEFTF